MIEDLFPDHVCAMPRIEAIADGATLLRGWALASAEFLLDTIEMIVAQAPFRHMVTPGGFTMSAAMTNCGCAGWVTDRSGYRYASRDPVSDKPWPNMPSVLRDLASGAARAAGFEGFDPDACLINCYEPGARLSLHQDRNERDMSQPIVSVSLGLPALFQFGGLERSARVAKYVLHHGDIAVWGGPSRLRYHGISTIREGDHPLVGRRRINLTFRRAR